MTQPLPKLQLLSVKIPVSNLPASRRWYVEVFGLPEEMEWPDQDGVVRGVALAGLGDVLLALALAEHAEAAAATREFGFLNVRVPVEDDLAGCAQHLDQLQISHTPVINAATGRLVARTQAIPSGWPAQHHRHGDMSTAGVAGRPGRGPGRALPSGGRPRRVRSPIKSGSRSRRTRVRPGVPGIGGYLRGATALALMIVVVLVTVVTVVTLTRRSTPGSDISPPPPSGSAQVAPLAPRAP